MAEVLPFFIYGTARIGEPLHDWVKDITEASCVAMAPHAVLMLDARETFPYLVARPGSTRYVWGDLLMLRKSPDLNRFIDMELNVGYSLEGIRVEHNMDDLPPFALTFLWADDEVDLHPFGHVSWLDRPITTAR